MAWPPEISYESEDARARISSLDFAKKLVLKGLPKIEGQEKASETEAFLLITDN
jgi:hypothetical protein